MSRITKEKPNYELNKLYLDQLQQQINDKKMHQIMDKNISMLEDHAMINQQILKDNIEKIRAKNKILTEKSELNKYQLIHMLQLKQKEKKSELSQTSNISSNIGLSTSNDTLPKLYKEKFIKHSPFSPRLVENERYNTQDNSISTDRPKYTQERIKSEKYENIPLDFIYFKNKELGYSGSLPYAISNQNIESQLKVKYDNRKSQNNVRLNSPDQSKAIGKEILKKEKLTISYENALKDINVLSKYKKLQDQKLTKLLLDEQTGRKSNQLLNSHDFKSSYQTANNQITQLSNLEHNIIVNPMDNYTHNRYIAKLRNEKGLHWESLN